MSEREPPYSALRELLLCLADDEFVMGYANSEWTGIAPVLEEDIAFSSLAQDELAHARVFYELLAELEGCSIDSIAYGRAPHEYRHAQLVERPRGDWAYSVSRQFLYDSADYVRIESLRNSSYMPLAQAAASILREEKYHLLHANTWLQHLAQGSPEAQRRQRESFNALWPDALAFFEPPMGEAELLAAKILPESFVTLQQRWLGQIADALLGFELPFPLVRQENRWEAQVTPVIGGRRGVHGQSFLTLYDEITSVYRLDPNAQW
jgi:ring-1,2-phenylacetyl-CoA epoxidase subunit PaaC